MNQSKAATKPNLDGAGKERRTAPLALGYQFHIASSRGQAIREVAPKLVVS
jgi:hypothetical protein